MAVSETCILHLFYGVNAFRQLIKFLWRKLTLLSIKKIKFYSYVHLENLLNFYGISQRSSQFFFCNFTHMYVYILGRRYLVSVSMESLEARKDI